MQAVQVFKSEQVLQEVGHFRQLVEDLNLPSGQEFTQATVSILSKGG